jgi:hypothetical protein
VEVLKQAGTSAGKLQISRKLADDVLVKVEGAGARPVAPQIQDGKDGGEDDDIVAVGAKQTTKIQIKLGDKWVDMTLLTSQR